MPIGYSDVAPNSSGRHYALTHNWDIAIDVGQLPAPLNALAQAFGVHNGIINTACIQVNNLPNSNMNEGILSANIRGVPFQQPASRESSVREINISMYEFWDYRVFRFFETWKNMAVNRFDYSQNLNAMIPSGVTITWTDSDRQNKTIKYVLQDIVCTKCNLAGELASEPEISKVQVSLKFGNYRILSGNTDENHVEPSRYEINAL